MTNDKDCAALGGVKTGRFTVEDSLFVEARALVGSHVYLWQTSPDSGIEAQITLSRDGALAFGRELVARLSTPQPAFDAAGVREAVAVALWKCEAERAAPNVAKGRNAVTFHDQLEREKEKWLGLADAALSALSHDQRGGAGE